MENDRLLPPSRKRILHSALAGFCAVLVGNGLGRFAYTPLLPALISDHWFTPSAAAYLGAANLAGYLGGAVLVHATARYARPAWVLRAMMVLTAVSLLACAARDLGFGWFFVWRFLAGYAGGVIMVVGATGLFFAWRAFAPTAKKGSDFRAVVIVVAVLAVVMVGCFVLLIFSYSRR